MIGRSRIAGEVVEPGGRVDVEAKQAEKVDDLGGGPADEESTTDNHRHHDGIASSLVYGSTRHRSHLKIASDLTAFAIISSSRRTCQDKKWNPTQWRRET